MFIHLARDVAYAEEASEDVLPSRLRLWLKKAFALADGVGILAASTIPPPSGAPWSEASTLS